jgi:hypothetical protein
VSEQHLEKIQWKQPRPWPVLDKAALHGIIGEIVRLIADQSEADPAAILITLLAGLGSISGPFPHVKITNASHPARIFAVIVGISSEGAKGTSYEDVLPFLCMVDQEFKTRIRSGFGSGEGIISEFADQKETDNDKEKEEKAPEDKRCFIIEEEFSRILTVGAREGSTLSEILRQAWGGGVLSIIRAKDRIIANGAHISLIGHITPDELKKKLASVDMVNGFANRFLFMCSKRVNTFPFGGDPDTHKLKNLANQIAAAVANLGARHFHFDDGARAAWAAFCYAQKPGKGLLDALLARARPQCLRLAVAYAIADGLPVIRTDHIRAALAVWSYSLESADYLFGDLCEDKTQAKILDLLRAAYPGSQTLTEISAAFGRHRESDLIQTALDDLETSGLIRSEMGAPKGGRPAKHFFAVPPAKEAKEAKEDSPEVNTFPAKEAKEAKEVSLEAPKGGLNSLDSLLSQPTRENKGQNHPPPPPNPPPFRPGVGMEIAPNGSTRPASRPKPEAVEEIGS